MKFKNVSQYRKDHFKEIKIVTRKNWGKNGNVPNFAKGKEVWKYPH
jgi:hypothetical protein